VALVLLTRALCPMIATVDPKGLLGDKAYDADAIREDLCMLSTADRAL
jgi:hypothetical protein